MVQGDKKARDLSSNPLAASIDISELVFVNESGEKEVRGSLLATILVVLHLPLLVMEIAPISVFDDSISYSKGNDNVMTCVDGQADVITSCFNHSTTSTYSFRNQHSFLRR